MDTNTIALPIQATGRLDVGRLLREVEQIDSFLKQAAIREPGTTVKMPKTSRLLDELTTTNKMNLLHEDDRSQLLSFLAAVKASAPVLHMSFGVDPSPSFIQKLMTWLRAEIHPLVLVQVGLQPNIGAGCVVRSTNHYFDFTLRQHFKKQRPLLLEKLHGDMEASALAVSEENTPIVENAPVEEQPQTAPVPQSIEVLSIDEHAQGITEQPKDESNG